MKKLYCAIGERFERLTVLARLPKSVVLCRCDCGSFSTPTASDLKKGLTRSCGCLRREVTKKTNSVHKTTHKMTGTSTYVSWTAMKARCLDPEHHAAHNYSQRGIALCDEWNDFEAFYRDMGKRPPGTTLDRIDNSLGYSRQNCRWATHSEQGNNRRGNVLITFQEETMTIAQWSRRTGIGATTIKWRVDRGWPPERILSSVGVRKA